MNYYGYNFTERNNEGLGEIMHDIMLAFKYSIENSLVFCFVKEGYDIPRLNGSINDNIELEDKNWHSYFISFPIIEKDLCLEIWPTFLKDTIITKWNIHRFSNVLQNDICIFQPNVYTDICNLVSQTSFNENTDIVLHISHRKEKMIEINNSIDIQIYIDECEKVLNQFPNEKNRIYICTDDPSLCFTIKDYFKLHHVDVIWDCNESNLPLQELTWNGKLEKHVAHKETMHAFKNLFIMKNTKKLIGSRMSYFFRIAELLAFPKKSINIQDSDVFGIAPYSSEQYLVRSHLKKTILGFVNEHIKNKEIIQTFYKIYKETNIVNIPQFISSKVLEDIRDEIENYPWFVYATIPNNNVWECKYNNTISEETVKECLYNLEMKQFTYRFKRCLCNHYSSCYCITCRLYETIDSFYVKDIISNIIGCNNLVINEHFLSNYSKDDFITIHGDTKKGDIAVTFSFTYDWHPSYGGILHFTDKDRNIYKSIVPSLGSITIFKLDPEKGLDHFVSCINVNKNRYTITAWYNIVD